MSTEILSSINEQIFEVRYKPSPTILDVRGKWANELSNEIGFNHWTISENRINVYDDSKLNIYFISYKNIGMKLINTTTRNYFYDKAKKFLKKVFSFQEFSESIQLDRLGVRSRFCAPFKGSFEELLNLYSTRYLRIPEALINALGNEVKIVDLGCNLDFVDSIGNFKTMSGPMKKDQLENTFSQKDGFPEVGIYFDIDYWKKPDSTLNCNQICTIINEFSVSSWDRFSKIKELLLG